MATVSNTKLLSAITSMPLSATAIAKKVGLSKGSQIQGALDELVDNGDITVDNSGRFPVYTKVASKKSTKKNEVAVKSETATATSNSGECTFVPTDGRETSVSLDPQIIKDLSGYTIKKPVTNKQGQVGARITTPILTAEGKNKTIFVAEGKTLVVINDKPSYIVDKPIDVVNACHSFAKDKGFTAYNISQLGVGNINGANGVKMQDIVSMKISKVDKGA